MMQTFAELHSWLDNLPNQQDGNPGYIAHGDEPYVEFLSSSLARPNDVAVIERAVAGQMFLQLKQYFNNRKGRIYWRKRLETDVRQHDVVLRHDENGPDMDFETNQKCVSDKNWMRVACYCRLYRSKN